MRVAHSIHARLLAEDGVPVFVLQGRERQVPGRATPIALPMQEGRIQPADIVAALAERGFKRLLIEGGATLGYWATGNWLMAVMPISIISKEMTQAKMGRSIKNLDMKLP